jgi:vitamin B12 transporter
MFKKTFVIAAVISLSLCFCLTPAVFADGVSEEKENAEKKQDESMFTEEVEVVGNVPVVNTIQSVSIFKKSEIEKFNFESLKSVLKLTPGLLTLSTGQFGQVSSLSIRGSKPTQVLYVVDGIKLRDGAGIGGVDLAILSPNLLDRLEVVRGPLSNIYGSDAVGGVVSMSTLDQEGAQFSASIGNHGSYSGNFSGGAALKAINLGLTIDTRRYSNDIVNDVFKNTGLSAKVNYKNESLETGLRFFGSYTNSGIPFNYGLSTPERKYRSNYTVLALPVKFRFNSNNSVDVKLAYTNSRYEFEDPQDLWGPYFLSNFDNYEAEVTYIGRFFEKLDFRVGFDYSDQEILNENNLGKILDNENMSYFSTFASTALDLDALQVSASLRYDKYKDVTASLSPQVGFSYLAANKLKLRAAYSQSFLAPLVTQLVNPWGIPNLDLKPEKGKSFEVGAEFYSAPVTFSATYFNTRYEDMIDWVTTDWVTFAGQYRNIKNVDTYGVELALTVQPWSHLTLSGAYTFLHTEDRATGEPLIRKPKHTFSGFAAFVFKRFTLSLSMIYVGRRLDYDYAAWPPDVENPSYNTFDFSLVVPVSKGLTAFGKLTNAFDREYQELVGYPAPGRRFELGLKYRIK